MEICAYSWQVDLAVRFHVSIEVSSVRWTIAEMKILWAWTANFLTFGWVYCSEISFDTRRLKNVWRNYHFGGVGTRRKVLCALIFSGLDSRLSTKWEEHQEICTESWGSSFQSKDIIHWEVTEEGPHVNRPRKYRTIIFIVNRWTMLERYHSHSFPSPLTLRWSYLQINLVGTLVLFLRTLFNQSNTSHW